MGDGTGDPPEERGGDDFQWADLRRVTSRDPDQIEELSGLSGLELTWPLLRSLVGQSPLDFLVRTAALRSITSRGRAHMSNDDIDRALNWLREDEKDSVLNALRQRHWLEHDAKSGWAVTTEGIFVLEVVGLLHKHVSDIDLFTSVTALEAAQEWDLPIHSFLNLMLSRLAKLRAEIEAARATRSPIILQRTKSKISAALEYSDMVIRALRSIPRNDERGHETSRRIHGALSALHDASSRLEQDITTTGRQYITLPEGYTLEQVTRSLMSMETTKLAGAARDALRPAYVPLPQVNAHALIFAAEAYLTRDRYELPAIDWREPAPAEAAPASAEGVATDGLAFVEELELLARSHDAAQLRDLLPRGSAEETFLRLSVLGFLDDEREGEGLAARVGRLPLSVELDDEGWPETLEGKPIRRLSKGIIRRRIE